MGFWTLGRVGTMVSIPALLVACAVNSEPGTEGASGGGEVPTASATATPSEDGGPSAYPILAPVDTGATMTAAPGKGVGVFTQYAAGGTWTLWWTCDSLVDSTNPPCLFDVKIGVQSGSITDVTQQGFQPSDTLTSSSTQLEAVTSTAAGQDGLTFTTAPGAVITLSATVGGQYDGRFVFFVEGGKVDDGFTGTVTDPILLQGSSP